MRQLRIQNRRAQVAKQTQLGANFQQATLRAQRRIDGVPLRTTNCTQQYRVSGTGALQGFVSQRHAVTVVCSTTQVVETQLEAEIELAVGHFQHLDRFGHDLRTNTIARQDQNLFAHVFPRNHSWCTAPAAVHPLFRCSPCQASRNSQG